MRIQHNIAALNSYRNLTNNNSAVSKNLEKLSSGYRINRAGDDAAGLAISEKMRAQITGLETAQKNANDGISLVQTAEGALTEVHSMLNRMVELADQSANGTYQNEVDRENLQAEMDALKDEINRIADSTNFNGINLLDGSLAAQTGAESVSLGTAEATLTTGTAFEATITVGTYANGSTQTFSIKYLDQNGDLQEASVTFTADGTDATKNAAAIAAGLKNVFGSDYTVAAATDSGEITITATANNNEETQVVSAKVGDTSIAATDITNTAGKADSFAVDLSGENADDNTTITVDGQKYQILVRGSDTKLEDGAKAIYIDQSTGAMGDDAVAQIANQLQAYGVDAKVDGTDATTINITKSTDGKNTGGLILQIGDTADDFNQMTVSVGDMHTTALGIDGIDISTQDGAKAAVDMIKNAINSVSSTRGDLGALQNRLEHTINNLSVTTENMTAAESRIRDVDMAEEMMAYTKNNILVQASQAMLAQANQIPQGVLQLLQ